jgi:hypothetical protein
MAIRNQVSHSTNGRDQKEKVLPVQEKPDQIY